MNFENKLSIAQSELAIDVIKDPFVFELEGIKENIYANDIQKNQKVIFWNKKHTPKKTKKLTFLE